MNMINQLVNRLIDAAKAEEWKKVDELFIPELVERNDPYSVAWAVNRGLYDENENVRDAAASLLGKQPIPQDLIEVARLNLFSVAMSDPHVFAKYRAAIALAKIGADVYKDHVREVLLQAVQMEDVREPAQEALDLLK